MQAPDYVRNTRVLDWVAEVAELTQPKDIYWCTRIDTLSSVVFLGTSELSNDTMSGM